MMVLIPLAKLIRMRSMARFFGAHVMAFESGAPAASIILDDLLTAKIGGPDLEGGP